MKIVPIFANKLYSFQYEGEADNEYDRLMTLWTDPSWLREFLKENQSDLPTGYTINQTAMQIYEDSEKLDDTLKVMVADPQQKLETFFRPVYNQEHRTRTLSKQKAKLNYLRLYALRIDEDCFVITGGAIKLTHLMEERSHTGIELVKLEKARSFLQEESAFEEDAFFELLIELKDEA